MYPPDEMMTDRFLPALRQLVSSRLRREGMSQAKISSLLGVTQASVSMYLSSGSERAYEALAAFHLSKDESDGIAESLVGSLNAGASDSVSALGGSWKKILGSGRACDLHRSMYASLAGCDFCIKEYGGPEAGSPVESVRDAVRLLEGTSDFIEVVPEVSTNLVYAPPGTDSVSGVVAIPGRLVRAKGRVRALLGPEAGASQHMAKVLLMVRTRRPEFCACVDLRYDSKMEVALRRAGLRALRLAASRNSSSPDRTATSLAEALRRGRHDFDVVVEPGGTGIEPVVYVFSNSPSKVAEAAIRLSKAYSAS